MPGSPRGLLSRGSPTPPSLFSRCKHTDEKAHNALERREWTAEEDEIIKDGVRQYGYRWRRIASQLQGRSDDAVRNRWSRLELQP